MKSFSRHPSLWILLATLFCILTDAILLMALPRLGLSFGAVGLPLFLISIVRLALLTPVLLLLIICKGLARQAASLVGLVIILQSCLLAVEVDALYVEPFRLGVTGLPVAAPAFFPDRPLRILQISDLHVEHISPREREVLAQANALQPDLIVLTGDYVNLDYLEDPQAVQEARQVLAQLHAPYGVYAVNGTTDTPFVMAAFDGLDIHVLYDEIETIRFQGDDLYLLGVATRGDTQRERRTLLDLMAAAPADAYTLLLYHTPDLIETASASSVDLYLAGHTHGGQIRLPFHGAVFTFSEYGKKYEMGEYIVGPTTLYVTRGLGMEGFNMPRARFLCPPEIVLVELGP